jgi:hypothetical protein
LIVGLVGRYPSNYHKQNKSTLIAETFLFL